MPKYHHPDFDQDFLKNAPNVKLEEVKEEGISPRNYHALSVFPEYFKVNDKWVLATESRMDTVCVVNDTPGEESVDIVEFRNLKVGDKVAIGRTEDASEGIYVWTQGFLQAGDEKDTFAFRSGRSRETAFSMDYDNLYETINLARKYGSTKALVESGQVKDGFIKACVENDVDFVIASTIRDRFGLPETINNVYEAQDAMRAHSRKTSTIIMLSAILFTIATGNMTPSYNEFDGEVRPVYMYTVDIQEFAVNKLSDRGTVTAVSMVTNTQDFIRNVDRALNN